MCPLQGDLLSVTFDPEMAEMCLLTVTTFGGHYVATIKVVIALVIIIILLLDCISNYMHCKRYKLLLQTL